MRHEKLPKAAARPVTRRRLQAAERALKRERDRYPLFAREIAEEQPSPEERIAEHDAEQVAHWQGIRDYAARTWHRARRLLDSLGIEEKEALRSEWNRSSLPGRAEYFADFLWRRTGKRATEFESSDP